MPTIQAWQHIYSNVEREQSPKQIGGFQTLFYSHAGLTEDEVSEMEGRLLYFPSNKGEPVKRLFFSTSSGKGVVAQITPLPEPDQYGRKGRYLAHALAFTPEDLAKFEVDPFRVFRSFTFFSSVAEALQRGNFETGDIPPVRVDLPQTSSGEVKAAQAWSSDEWQKLALLALRVERQTQGRAAITVTGPFEAVEATLEAAFLAVPTVLRPRCTFDTYFYRCNLVATFYWAIGLPESPVSIKFVKIDAVARQIEGAAPTQPETAYERWVCSGLTAQKLAGLPRQRDQAFALGEWLDGRPHAEALLDAAPPEVIAAMFEVNPEAVRAAVRRRAGEQLSPELAGRAGNTIYQQSQSAVLYSQLRQGFTPDQLLAALYSSYEAEKFAAPARSEIKALGELLAQKDQPLLRLFVAHWQGRRELAGALQEAEPETYRRFVEMALRLELIEPLRLLAPGKAEVFVPLYLNSKVVDWVDLVEALLNSGQAAGLAPLSPRMKARERKDLVKIKNLIEGQNGVPQEFQQAVARAIEALPPEGGIKGFIKSAWRRLPGRGG